MKDLRHQVPNLCIIRLKGIQRGQVARSFFRSWRPRAPSLRESKVETSGQMPRRAIELRCFGKERGRDPAHWPGLLGVFRQNVLQNLRLLGGCTHALRINGIEGAKRVTDHQKKTFRKRVYLFVVASDTADEHGARSG